MVREDTTNPSLLNNSRRQMKNVIPTPKYERRQPRGKSMDRGRLLSFFNSLTHLLCTLSAKDRGANKNPAVDLEIILVLF